LVKSWGSKKGGPGESWGVGNPEKGQKPEKGSKNPPAKTPYDAKYGFINAVVTKKGEKVGFREVILEGFLEAWALPVASCLCRAYTMPTHYNNS